MHRRSALNEGRVKGPCDAYRGLNRITSNF
jgi:hypothetical protein